MDDCRIVDNIYSEQHYSYDSSQPHNSLRTYIKGNSRLAKLQFWHTTDQKELALKKAIDELKEMVTLFDEYLVDKCIIIFKKINEFYSKNKIKKNKNKMYIYSIYWVLKNEGRLVSHKIISDTLKLSNKKICNSIKEIYDDIYNTDFIKNYEKIQNNQVSISNFISLLNLSWEYLEPTEFMFNELYKSKEFNNHKPISLLASIFNFFGIDKKLILDVFQISETTIYQITKKIQTRYYVE